MTKELTKLTSLYLEMKLNRMVYDANIIPKSTYEKVAEELAVEVDRLEKICYNTG